MKIVIVEDEREVASQIRDALENAGHEVVHADNGDDGERLIREEEPHVIVVDRMLPEQDGLTLIAKLREDGVSVPALILSALGQVDDRVEGLRAGGDDYLPKPFSMDELLARIEVLSRRGGGTETSLTVGDLTLDRIEHVAERAGQTITLQPREYRLLEYLMRNAGQVVTRKMLLENVWDYHFDPGTNVIDVHVSRLRAKIDKEFDVPLLHTERGTGYRMEAEGPGEGRMSGTGVAAERT